MRFGVEAIMDDGVGGEEVLSGALGFELLLLSFSSPDWKIGVFCPVVLLQAIRTMAVREVGLPLGLWIGSQPVCDDRFGAHAGVLQQTVQ